MESGGERQKVEERGGDSKSVTLGTVETQWISNFKVQGGIMINIDHQTKLNSHRMGNSRRVLNQKSKRGKNRIGSGVNWLVVLCIVWRE